MSNDAMLFGWKDITVGVPLWHFHKILLNGGNDIPEAVFNSISKSNGSKRSIYLSGRPTLIDFTDFVAL